MSHATSDHLSPAGKPRLAVQAVLDVLRPLAGSSDPVVVCTNAVRLCVPYLCDIARIELVGPGEQAHQVSWPRPEPDDVHPEIAPSRELHSVHAPGLTRDTVYTPIRPAAGDDGPEFFGVLALWFEQRRPALEDTLIGQLVVERIVSTIQRERLRSAISDETARADHLQQALLRNRQIGAALGILMASQKCTIDQAFDQMRRASQISHRKMHEIALDIMDTGVLEISPKKHG